MLIRKIVVAVFIFFKIMNIFAEEVQIASPIQKNDIKKVDNKSIQDEEKLKNKLFKMRKERVLYFLDKRIMILNKEKKCLKKIKSNEEIKKCNEQSQISYKDLRLELEKSKNEYAEEKKKIEYLNLEKSGIALDELEIEITN